MRVSDDDYDVLDQFERASVDRWADESPAFYVPTTEVVTVERELRVLSDGDYREMARQDYAVDNGEECLVIDADPIYKTKNGDEDVVVTQTMMGAWVQAWVWVSNDRFEED